MRDLLFNYIPPILVVLIDLLSSPVVSSVDSTPALLLSDCLITWINCALYYTGGSSISCLAEPGPALVFQPRSCITSLFLRFERDVLLGPCAC